MNETEKLAEAVNDLQKSFYFWKGVGSVLAIVIPAISLLFIGYEWWAIPRKITESTQEEVEKKIGSETTAKINEALKNAQTIKKIVQGTARLSFATGLDEDGTDVGRIVSRTLRFKKERADTAMRIGYTDNLRVEGRVGNAGCRWEIKFNGSSCPGGIISFTYFALATENPHRSRHVIGYCEAMKAGTYEMQVWVDSIPDYPNSDCYTGWQRARWTLEVEEVLVRKDVR